MLVYIYPILTKKQTRNLASFSSSLTTGSHFLVSKCHACYRRGKFHRCSEKGTPVLTTHGTTGAKVSFCFGYDFITSFLHKKSWKLLLSEAFSQLKIH